MIWRRAALGSDDSAYRSEEYRAGDSVEPEPCNMLTNSHHQLAMPPPSGSDSQTDKSAKRRQRRRKIKLERAQDVRTKLPHGESNHTDGAGDENVQFELPSGSRANIDSDLQLPRHRKQKTPPDANQCQGECCRAKMHSEGPEGEGEITEKCELSERSAGGREQDARGLEQDARRAERRSKRPERSSSRTRKIRHSTFDPVEGYSKDLVIPTNAEERSSSFEGRSRGHERPTHRRRERRPRLKHKYSLFEHLAQDPQPHFTASLDDCQIALRNAEQQRDEMNRRVLEQRVQGLDEATKKRKEAKSRKQAEKETNRTHFIMEETESRLAPREHRKKRGTAPGLEVPAGISEQTTGDRRKLAHAARIRERKQAHIALMEREHQEREAERAREAEAAREAERAEAEFQMQVELEQRREREERALLSVRAAERERQMMLLLSPQSVYHARTHPPPRDEYTTVDEDIPPYRAQLHKYLDLVAYDERFAPVLRVNRYLIYGDSELTEAIDKFKQFNLLPRKTDLWSISHVDDNEYEQMIPALLPEHSYGNELEGF